MSKKNLIKIVGKTIDGKIVVSGLLRFKETYGLPLECILDFLPKNMIPSWKQLLDEAIIIGIKREHFLKELKTIIIDIYGKDFLEYVWKYIETYQWFKKEK